MTIGYTYDHLPADFSDRSLRADVLAGLTATAKWLPPKWFYDKVGSELFEDITRLPEYYPTRTERAILRRTPPRSSALAGSRHADRARVRVVGEDPAAAGRDAAPRRPAGAAYVALDVSEDALRSACAGLVARLPAAAGRARCGPISPTSWTCCPAGPEPDGRLPRQHDRQLRPGRASRVPAAAAGRRCGPAITSCSAPTWSSRPTSWSPPTTTRPGSPRRSTSTCSTC